MNSIAQAVEFGVGDLPSAFRRLRVQPSLQQFLLEAFTSTTDAETLEQMGLERQDDYDLRVPGHVYFMKRYHALERSSEPVNAIDKRSLVDMQHPAAPLALRAFAVAFRRVNAEWLFEAVRGTPLEYYAIRDCLLSEVQLQVHYGDCVRVQNIGWHVDALGSALHLALSINGKRTLHAIMRSAQMGADLSHSVLNLDVGDVYISSPCAYKHAVEFPDASFPDCTISVQFRILTTLDEYRHLEAAARVASCWKNTLQQVARVLDEAPVRLPCLEEVQAVSDELESQSCHSASGCCVN